MKPPQTIRSWLFITSGFQLKPGQSGLTLQSDGNPLERNQCSMIEQIAQSEQNGTSLHSHGSMAGVAQAKSGTGE